MQQGDLNMTHSDIPPVLDVCDLSVTKGDPQTATFTLEVPELSVAPGQIVAIVGAPGCGKTTLLDLLSMSIVPDTCARLEIAGRTTDDKIDKLTLASTDYEAAIGGCRPHIGYVLQSGGLLPFLSIWENVALPSQTFGRRVPAALISTLSARLGIANKLDLRPKHLTVSQLQRAAVLRSLVHRPSLLLVDEMPIAVSSIRARKILSETTDIVREQGGSAIIAARTPDVLDGLADQIYTFHQTIDALGKHSKSICQRRPSHSAFDLQGNALPQCGVFH